MKNNMKNSMKKNYYYILVVLNYNIIKEQFFAQSKHEIYFEMKNI